MSLTGRKRGARTPRERALAMVEGADEVFAGIIREMTEHAARRWITHERRRLAYHEAGHAVVALSLVGGEVDAVTIRRGADFLGRCYMRLLPEFIRRGRRWVVDPKCCEAAAVMLLAGFVAEIHRDGDHFGVEDVLAQFDDNDMGGATKDFGRAFALLGEAGHKGRKLEAAKWRSLEAAERVIKDKWRTVDAVARELIRHGHLNRDRLEALVAATRAPLR